MTKRKFWLKLFQENDTALACAIHFCERFVDKESLQKGADFIAKKRSELNREVASELLTAVFGEGEKDLEKPFFKHQSEDTFNQKLSVEQLKELSQRAWVWIEILKPYSFGEKVSAYYRIDYDYTSGRALCCGYPGITFNFYYADYDKTWTAYQYEPKRSDSK